MRAPSTSWRTLGKSCLTQYKHVMTIRASLSEYACSALALLVMLSAAGEALGQQQTPPAVPGVSTDDATSSTEQGRTPLPDSFQTGREWRLEKRRGALQDTQFRFNIRTYYFDRKKFDGSESEAFTIGGWVGLKTGYFLDHVSFGVTGYTSQKLVAIKTGMGPYS
jgi:hypothetical protein